MFNKLVGYVNWIPRIADTDFLLLVSIIQIAIVQSWAVVGDWEEWSNNIDIEGPNLAEYTKELASMLLEKE